MTDLEFWRLIEDARASSNGECETQAEHLMQLLLKVPPAEIVEFDEIFDQMHDAAYRWDVWGAASLMIGFCSDDGFAYFRNWLIGQGRDVYERALKDADSLADVVDSDQTDYECEELWYIAGRAYQRRTGEDINTRLTHGEEVPQSGPTGERIFPQPAGVRLNDDDDLDAIYPRLAARLNEMDALAENMEK